MKEAQKDKDQYQVRGLRDLRPYEPLLQALWLVVEGRSFEAHENDVQPPEQWETDVRTLREQGLHLAQYEPEDVWWTHFDYASH